jgi:apolipoprotein D and lipocalin family protein
MKKGKERLEGKKGKGKAQRKARRQKGQGKSAREKKSGKKKNQKKMDSWNWWQILLVVVGVVLLIAFLWWTIASIVSLNDVTAPLAAASVDLSKYVGRWYEVARFPNWFEKQCGPTGAGIADYSAVMNGTDGTLHHINVVNSCLGSGGVQSQAQGIAVPAAGTKLSVLAPTSRTNGGGGLPTILLSPAKLQVGFGPLQWWSIAQAPYWILDVDESSYSLVGSPDRQYLWVLSRTPTMDPALLAQLVEKARQMRYPVERLQLVA